MIKPFPSFENIHTVMIPFPNDSRLISANLYALGKSPVTLIDTGPKIPGMLETIQERLNYAGIQMTDIYRIIITHGHIDHFGLAVSIRQMAGHSVQCYIHKEDQWRLSPHNLRKDVWSQEEADFLIRAGITPNKIEKVKAHFSFFKTLCDPLEDLSLMEEGDEFSGDKYHLKVIHTPGHSAGSCCILESHHKILFSGDHVIKHITPNPLVELNRNNLTNPNYQSLKSYLESLEKIEKLDVQWVFPGHGEHIDDLKRVIAAYRDHHNQRKKLVWRSLRKNLCSISDLIEKIFPALPDTELFLAASDIWAHLELLLNERRITLIDSGPPEIYLAI